MPLFDFDFRALNVNTIEDLLRFAIVLATRSVVISWSSTLDLMMTNEFGWATAANLF